MVRVMQPGQIIGQPGRGLDDAPWAANESVRQIGQNAEVRTGQELASVVHRGPSVLHDLRIPMPGISANIDHLVVAGDQVLILDSKRWASGFYWTVGGVTRRGWKPFAPADKKTLPMARDALARFLSKRGIQAELLDPVLVIWSSEKPNLTFYKPSGKARKVHGDHIGTWVRRHVPRKNASGDLLVTLAELAN